MKKRYLYNAQVGKGLKKMHKWAKDQDLLKWMGLFLGHSLTIIKWTWIFSMQFDHPLPPPTIRHKVVCFFSYLCKGKDFMVPKYL